jgi:hypothetical protein
VIVALGKVERMAEVEFPGPQPKLVSMRTGTMELVAYLGRRCVGFEW